MAGLFTELSVAGRRALETRRRLRAGQLDPTPDIPGFRQAFQTLLDRAPPGLIADARWMPLPANAPPWVDSGLQLNPGDAVSWFICGRTWASKALDIWVPPSVQVWGRIGQNGDLISATRDSHSITADIDGTLQFGNYFPNDWADRQGRTTKPDRVYRALKGELLILVLRWTGDALTGLRQLQSLGEVDGDVDGRLASEIERLQQGQTHPTGWSPLWHVGNNEIYRDGQGPEGEPAICCHTHGDVGILQRDVDFALTADTRLDWRWIIHSLPSSIREDAVPSHDYLSIAVEFDNGMDITYYWSSVLPTGTGYICPLPNWKHREYHVVVRSGTAGLGEWLDESRPLHDDYQRYMAGRMSGTDNHQPKRIVRIWLIANSVFQRGSGDCRYAGIRLSNTGGASLTVL